MKRNDKAHAKSQLSCHAFERMEQRDIDHEAIEVVLDYGREVYTRGAIVHAIGRREIEHWEREGIDLSRYDGVQVVCSQDGTVLTVYRNRNFRRLRTGLGRGRHNRVARCQTA
ncbi:MAG: DUF4258 domain-containing protein [Planctomycetales bacterium]|nr:DUF4258 domain-containing protein [Planctomycetales bacterium]